MPRLALGRLTGFVLLALAGAGPAAAAPQLWMFPTPFGNGQQLKELFANPAAWVHTRHAITGIGYADHWLNSQFNDAQLRAWFPQLRQWGVKLNLEVGSVKPGSPTGEKAFAVSHPRWDRFIADGAQIDSITMDEPLAATVINMHLPVQTGVEETAQFVARVRHAYPSISIGDIEPYPYFQPGQILAFTDAVQARLRQMGVKGLDFIRLDVDWMHFHPGDPKGALGWRGVKQIEDQCHRRGLRFSLIYWAADYGALRQQGGLTPDTWTSAILQQAASYQAVGGVPDEYFVESWLFSPSEPVPVHAIPETTPATLSGSVLALDASYVH